jgi:cytochrome c peroxidase
LQSQKTRAFVRSETRPTTAVKINVAHVLLGLGIVIANAIAEATAADVPHRGTEPNALADLGRALFFDTNLSRNRTQSCASCHDPARAFTDGRDNGIAGAVSLGDDGTSLGDRNAPSTAYAFMSPVFHKDPQGRYVGGQFYDGRAASLREQATEPLTNPIEMGLPDTASLLARIKENPGYVTMFRETFSASVLSDPERTSAAVGESIGAFVHTEGFAAFDSKYDRYLRGEYQMTAQEAMGRTLFFSPLTNCTSCHLLNTSAVAARETFTNYRYHNIGIPPNQAVRDKKGQSAEHRDLGLLQHPELDDPGLAGKFKVPTLRNVAVTGPYMHNGVFAQLRTAIVFYNKYTIHSKHSLTNPETGKPWGEPEIAETVDSDLLRQGQPINEDRASALIAFLKTLTDRRYEPLLNKHSADEQSHSTIDAGHSKP